MTELALQKGDKVVATLRKPEVLADLKASHPSSQLLIVPLDVSKPDQIAAAFDAAVKAFGVSPDGWTQMIIQLAYARLLRAKGWKRNGGTYEAASVRKFLKGRTEAIRVVSAESDAWVASMDDEGAGAERRMELFRNAIKKHGSDARAAGNAQGIDRHLLGE